MPAADEVWRLQNDDDAECRLFRRMATGGEAPSRGTLQGIYVCTPSGERLGGVNSLDAAAVAAMLRQALEVWDAGGRGAEPAAALAGVQRWEDCRPADGLVLVRTARDLPASLDPAAEPRAPFNRDQVWFSAAEARLWLPAELTAGAGHDVPPALVERLARFHLVDNVRGQTLPYTEAEVAGSALRCEVVGRSGDEVRLRITGATRAAAGEWRGGDNYWKPSRTWPRGVRTRVYGEAAFDLRRQRFTGFTLVALGSRWGRSVNNGRHADLGPAPIGFVLELAPAGSPAVAPTFINVYDADWVRDPRR